MTIIEEARALIARSAENTLSENHDVREYEIVEDENLAIGEAAIALLQKLVEPGPVLQTSASRRREQAKIVINAAIASAESEEAGVEDLIEHRDNLIGVLDDLTEPPSIGMPELVRDFRERITEQGSISVLGLRAVTAGGHEPTIEGYRLGLADGEQYAHERWEPTDRPTQEQMLTWLGLDYTEDGDAIVVHRKNIEKEV